MTNFVIKSGARTIATYKNCERAYDGIFGYAAVHGYDVICFAADADPMFQGCLDAALSKGSEIMLIRVEEEPCACAYCGETEDDTMLRIQCYAPYAGPVDDLVCEECFHGSDTGPCWDDLPQHGNPAWWL